MFQVSFFSTSTVLSSRDRYPFFLRTIPSDVHQAQVMLELVRMFGWTYVSVVYEESSYGMQVTCQVKTQVLKDRTDRPPPPLHPNLQVSRPPRLYSFFLINYISFINYFIHSLHKITEKTNIVCLTF